MRTVYGNHTRFETTYFKKFPGYYVTGDGEPWLSCPTPLSKTCTFNFHFSEELARGEE